MVEGDKVVFIGYEYNLAKILKYDEIFKDKELIIERISRCPCDSEYLDKLKFKGIKGYYRTSFFKKVEV